MQNEKKEEINISTMKIHQMPSKWQAVSKLNQSVIFQPKLAK